MPNTFSSYLQELNELNLPKGSYAIFGSGPLAIRNIRDTHDIDGIVKKDAYIQLCKRFPENVVSEPVDCIKLRNLEIGNNWTNDSTHIDEMIDTAEIINDYPFVKLEYVIEWKRNLGREKDKNDINLIEEYLRNQV